MTIAKDVSWQYCETSGQFEQVELVENLRPAHLLYRFKNNLQSFYYEKKRRIYSNVLKLVNFWRKNVQNTGNRFED